MLPGAELPLALPKERHPVRRQAEGPGRRSAQSELQLRCAAERGLGDADVDEPGGPVELQRVGAGRDFQGVCTRDRSTSQTQFTRAVAIPRRIHFGSTNRSSSSMPPLSVSARWRSRRPSRSPPPRGCGPRSARGARALGTRGGPAAGRGRRGWTATPAGRYRSARQGNRPAQADHRSSGARMRQASVISSVCRPSSTAGGLGRVSGPCLYLGR